MTFRSQGLAGRPRNTRLKGKNQPRRQLTDTRRRQERIGSEWLIVAILIAMVSYVTTASSQEDKKRGSGIIGTIVGYAVRGPL